MIHIVIGTKAQLIKMAPIMQCLQKRNIVYNYISTGQHQETMDDILNNFNLKPADYVLHRGKDITSVFSMALWAVKILLKTVFQRKAIFKNDKRKKGIVLVHGDTFSTLLGALMGRFAGLKVAHIESGLRSFNIWHPFPEEITRILTFRCAHMYFCPGEWAMANLKKYKGEKINTHYNTLLDALQAAKQFKQPEIDIPEKPFAIVTMHRYENIRNRKVMQKNIDLVLSIAADMYLLFIMHPVTVKRLEKFKLRENLETHPNIELRQRYSYFDFITLASHAEFLVSDGGSNQEECYYAGIPCLLLRKTTERRDGLDSNVIISAYNQETVNDFCQKHERYRKPQVLAAQSPSELIINHITPYTE